MSSPGPDNIASHRLAASESAALGLPLEDNNHDSNSDHQETNNHSNSNSNDPSFSPPPQQQPPTPSPTQPTRTPYESLIERNTRRDEVEPGLTHFRAQRDLHVRQLADLNKKSTMVSNRIDKINDDVEKLRLLWGELEREKAALLGSSERYEARLILLERRVHADDVRAKRYHDYLTLGEEVLVLDDDEEEDDEGDGDGDRRMFDWGVGGHGGGGGEDGEGEGEA